MSEDHLHLVTDHPVVGTQFGEYTITEDVFGRVGQSPDLSFRAG